MMFDPEEILRQIESNEWKWIGIKRFRPELYQSLEDRYKALENHHNEETSKLIKIIEMLIKDRNNE